MDFIMYLIEENPDIIFIAPIITVFMIFLYFKFCRKPKVKVIKAPTHKEVIKQHKKARRIRKIKRIFKIPYKGNAKIYEYDKTTPYIDAVWEELKKH